MQQMFTEQQERLIVAATGVVVSMYRRARNKPDVARVKVMEAVSKALSRTADGDEVVDKPLPREPLGGFVLNGVRHGGVTVDGVRLFRDMFDDFGIDRSDQVQQETVYRIVEKAVERKLAQGNGRRPPWEY